MKKICRGLPFACKEGQLTQNSSLLTRLLLLIVELNCDLGPAEVDFVVSQLEQVEGANKEKLCKLNWLKLAKQDLSIIFAFERCHYLED